MLSGPCVGEMVIQDFKQREQAVLCLIKDSGIEFDEVGIFGSYARNEFKATSDIDFCIITRVKPDRAISGELREDAAALKSDIVYVTPQYFSSDTSKFAINLRKDYRRLL